MTSRSDTRSPSFQEVLAALEVLNASEAEATDLRKVERIEVTIQGEIRTSDGKTIAIRLRDLSVSGFGFFHYGSISLGEVELKLRVNTYRIALKWCAHCKDNLCFSGGTIVSIQSPVSRIGGRQRLFQK